MWVRFDRQNMGSGIGSPAIVVLLRRLVLMLVATIIVIVAISLTIVAIPLAIFCARMVPMVVIPMVIGMVMPGMMMSGFSRIILRVRLRGRSREQS